MLTDLLLAIGHHLLIFALAAVIVAELVMTRPSMSGADLGRIAWLDRWYGILAALIVIVGFSRVHFGLKGPEFYETNPTFWAKIAAFVVVGLLSIVPTIRILRWRREQKANPAYLPNADELAGVQRFIRLEAGVFLLIPIFAAMMARGY
jgi:putative membrane protein